MDLASIIGLVLGVVMFIFGVMSSGGNLVEQFVHVPPQLAKLCRGGDAAGHVGFYVGAQRIVFGPLVFAFAKHLCFALLQNQPTAVGVGRCGLSEYFVGVWHRCFDVH